MDVLVIAVCTLLCGGETFNDMEDFGDVGDWGKFGYKRQHRPSADDGFLSFGPSRRLRGDSASQTGVRRAGSSSISRSAFAQ